MFEEIHFADGDDKPPIFISGLVPEGIKKKKIEIFDRELNKVAKVYWNIWHSMGGRLGH